MDSLDSPWPELEGSHHLPPYNILCASPRHPHPNGFLSWDSQGGVPKMSRFGLPRLCTIITFCSDLRLGWGLKQSCNSPWELSNGMSHSTCTYRGWVNSQLLVVKSQTTNLTPGPSFCHNLCYICPNGPCETIFDIYTLIVFQWCKEHPMRGVLTPAIELWSFGSPRGLPSPNFGNVSFILTLPSR
jgi:hypothetical protein